MTSTPDSIRLDRLTRVMAAMPYAAFLGIEARLDGDGVIAVMPFRADLIGNTKLPALHGGALGAFLELTAQMQLRVERDGEHPPATIGVTVEYLRPGKPRDTFAKAEILRLGRRIANVHVKAWQDSNRTPIVLLQGRFLIPDRH